MNSQRLHESSPIAQTAGLPSRAKSLLRWPGRHLALAALTMIIGGVIFYATMRVLVADVRHINQRLVQDQQILIEHRALEQLREETRLADQATLDVTAKWTKIIQDAEAQALSKATHEPAISYTNLTQLEPSTPAHQLHGPLRHHRLPEAAQDDWCRNALDTYVLDQLQKQGMAPPKPADSRTLVRRLWLSLTGLPPAWSDMEKWMQRAENDWEQLVDELLERPEFGEHLSTPWLDVVRYADSNGYEEDELRPHAFPYRDFVIWALQADFPYDEFVRWQIAGDEICPDNPLATAATGFLTASPLNTFIPQLSERYDELDNIISTIGQSMLGTTIACARCHDHFYDPILSQEYYGLAAIFQSTKRTETYLQPDRGAEYWQQAGWSHQYRDEMTAMLLQRVRDDRIEDNNDFTSDEKDLLRQPIDPENARQVELLSRCGRCLLVDETFLKDGLKPLPQHKPRYDFLQQELDRKRSMLPPEPPKALAITGSQVQQVPVLTGGSINLLGESVGPRFIDCLTQVKVNWADGGWTLWDTAAEPRPRTALARWMTDIRFGAGALLARVAVNRIWQHHFGVGLVRTPADFGAEGAPPSSAALLDWLAEQLVVSGWRQKHVHRLIVNSSTWRQALVSSDSPYYSEQFDSLLRRVPQRLSGEMFRDAILDLAGRLNRRRYGPAFQPAIPYEAIMYREEEDIDATWPTQVLERPDVWRRSVYILRRRSNPVPMLQLFDTPERSQPCAHRQATTVPTQALLLWNDPWIRDQAQHIAAQIESSGSATSLEPRSDPISQLFRLVYQRMPRPDELRQAHEFLETGALQDLVHVLLMSNEFWYFD
ncbi:MAG: DUF1553 domain-containing protein [Pirellulaceae bacterium]|nr:DUF1553 domain-containing protein [Pirellulaceae bacterium]